ncbi:MAG: hypothetical protein ACE5E9_13955 [Nitrospinaceae bacterium]
MIATLLRILIFAYAFNAFSLITADSDLWGHIKFGEAAWSEKAPLKTDPYSYTAPGAPWVNHEWLTEVLFYLIYKVLGSGGLLGFKLLIGLSIVALLTRLAVEKENNIFIYFLIFVLLIPVLAPGFMARPQLMSFLFMTLLVVLLHKFFDGQRGVLIWTPLLMIFWVNCHGGVVAGIGLYGAVTVSGWIRCRISGGPHGNILLKYFALSCAGLLINPWGYQLWQFFYQSLTLPRAIAEWEPVTLFNASFPEFKIMVLLFLGSLAIPGRKRIWEIVMIAGALYFALQHQRHTVLAAIIMTPYLTAQGSRLADRLEPGKFFRIPSSPWIRATIQGTLILLIALQVFGGFSKYRVTGFRILVEPAIYPTYAVQFMEANRIDGNLLVPFDWGEYLIWKRPGSKVSIDGRFRTVYPEKVIQENEDFAAARPGWRAMLENYPADIVILRKPQQTRHPLKGEKGWMKIYEDPLAMIFIRKTTPPGPIEQKALSRDLIRPTPPPPLTFPG